MGYCVEFDTLDIMYANISKAADQWISALEDLDNASQKFGMTGLSGSGAESVRRYMNTIHGVLSKMLQQIIISHMSNCLLYKRDYQDNIDSALHAVIKTDELEYIRNALCADHSGIQMVDADVRSSLGSVSDIFQVCGPRLDAVDDAYKAIEKQLRTLAENIDTLETRHVQNDFAAVSRLIDAAAAFINDQLSKSRSYKSSFSNKALVGSSTLLELSWAAQALIADCSNKKVALETAIDNENSRVADLQKEYEERKKEAQMINFVVAGVCIIAAVALTVCTGGTAAPLVVASVSAGCGFFMSGAANATSQYVQKGSMDKIDWGEVVGEATIGGVTGFISGLISTALCQGMVDALGRTVMGSAFTGSTSAMVRVGTHAVVGCASEVTAGVATRSIEEIVRGNWDGKEFAKKVFDKDAIMYDAISGGISSGVEEGIKSKKPFGDLMDPNDAARYDDFWRSKGIGSNNTWNAYKIANPEKNIDDYLDLAKSKSPWPSGTPDGTRVMKSGEDFYVVLNKGDTLEELGAWGTKTDIASIEDARTRLALSKTFKESPESVAHYWVKEGSALRVEYGTVGPQIDLVLDRYLPGGADQIHILIDNGKIPMDYLIGEYYKYID